MKKIYLSLSSHRELILLFILICFAAVLRFYRIDKLDFFTYDQARDATYIKRILVDHKFRLLGTQTSMPGMFLPPFYYYSVVPVLWLFKLNPIGIDIYSAFFGVLTVPLIFFVSNKIFGKPAGIFSALLVSISPLMVELTRRAWNPNTMPFFILISFYFLYKYFTEKKNHDLLLSFAFYGYSLSLHFSAWTLLPIFFLVWLRSFFKGRRKIIGLIPLLIIFFFISPILLFEARHNFFLISQAKEYFINGNRVGFNLISSLESMIVSFFSLFLVLLSGLLKVGRLGPTEMPGKIADLFTSPFPISVIAERPYSIRLEWWGIVMLLGIVAVSFYSLGDKDYSGPRKVAIKMLWFWIIYGIIVSRIYLGGFFFFYYLFLFPAVFLLFGFFIKEMWKIRKARFLCVILGIFLLVFNLRHSVAFSSSWRSFNDLKAVSEVISDNISEEEFNIATIRRDNDFFERNSVDYRYFVETFGKKSVLGWEPKDYETAEILFVVDETGATPVTKTNIMEINSFNPGEVIQSWEAGNGIKVYKLLKKKT